MSDVEVESLRFLLGRAAARSDWSPMLRALADELGEQVPVEDLKPFFRAIGSRVAVAQPLAAGTVAEFERAANHCLDAFGWGLLKVEDRQSSLDLQHVCAPLRQAFGESSMAWSPMLLEGLYAGWLRQLGAGPALELRQLGAAEGSADVLRFRFAAANQFA